MLTAFLPSPRYLACLVLACLLAVPAAAATITLSHAGSALAGGSIGGVVFGPTDFVITAVGDTDDRENLGFGFGLAHRSASIAIDGVGMFHFVDPTRTFVNNDVQVVGFGSPVGDLFDGPTNTALASYGLDRSIGPISGRGQIVQWDLLNIMTSGGTLLLTSSSDVPASFEATVAPIPLSAGGLLLLTALAGVPMLRRVGRRPTSHDTRGALVSLQDCLRLRMGLADNAMRTALLVASFWLAIPAPVAASEEISGQDEPRFQAALTAWLNEDDQASVSELAALAADNNRAAQVLLALIDLAPPLQGPWLAALPRSERIALLRAPGGLSGRSWMVSAAEDTPLAQLWVLQPTPDASLDTARNFAAMGEARAARTVLYELSRRQYRGFAALADDPVYPPDMRYLIWREWKADPVNLARIDTEIAGLEVGDPQLVRFDGRHIAQSDIEAWLAESLLAAPLRTTCEASCPSAAAACVVAAFDLLGGGNGVAHSHVGLSAFGTPSETLIPSDRWNESARARTALLRQSDLRFKAVSAPLEQIASRSPCLAEAISEDAARFHQ